MFRIINHKTYSDREYNEDTYGFSSSFMFVIDGASGLKDNDIMDCGDDAAWFVENVKKYLMQHLHEDKDVASILKESVDILYAQYKERVKEVDMVSMPSACISLFRIKDDFVEFYGLGDCVGVIEMKDGSVECLIDQNIEDLDQIAIDKMVEIAKKKNISPIKARPYIQDILMKHRTLRNTEAGYYGLDLSGDGLFYAMRKKYPLDKIKRIACLSDGLYEVVLFKQYENYPALLDAMEKDLDKVFTLLFDAQEEDKDACIVPRFKKRDDTTGIIARV